MGRAWLFSSLLHVALAALLYFGLPSLSRPPPAMEQAITVELVNEAPEAEAKPPAPAPATTAPTPARAAASPNPTPTPPPEPKVEPQPAPPPQQAEVPPPPEPAPPPPHEPEPPAKPDVAAVQPPPEPEPAPPPPHEPEPPKPDVAKAEPPPPPPPVVEPPPEVQPKPEPEPAPKPEVALVQPEPAKPEPPPAPQPPAPQSPAPRPLLKPAPPKVAEATPPPVPPPSTQKPAPAPPQEDAFAALLKSVEQLDRRVESDTTQTGPGRGAATTGQARNALGEAQLSFSEVDALRRQIGHCWTLPVGVEGIDDMVVQLRIQVRPDRTVQNVTIEDQGRLGRDPTFRAVAESARRAVDKCSPLILPPGKYAIWRDINLNFRPQDAING